MKILITCPPMIGMKEQFISIFERKGIEVFMPNVVQILSEEKLIELLPQFDGWIIGDDPATRKVFEAGKAGKLKAAVKWGIGVDNVDFDACKELNIPIINTPNMFGCEVADIAVAYVIGLARDLFYIDREVRKNNWPKNRGISLFGKKVGLIGYGDIGANVAKRLIVSEMEMIVYDPVFSQTDNCDHIEFVQWPDQIEKCDFLVFTCSLNDKNWHMLNEKILSKTKKGVRIVNVARGPLIDESALIHALQTDQVKSVALDVFEEEPLPANSPLHSMEYCILGSHNSSNTSEAVAATNNRAIAELFNFLNIG